jgi:Transglutaminase-like superfamily
MSAGMQMRAYHLPPGDAGVLRTVNRMESLVAGPEGVASPVVHETVRKAIRGSVRDVTEIDAWFEFVKGAIEFRGEAEETLQSPEVTLKLRSGDCDDLSMLIAAGMRSLGYETAFRTVATPDSGGEFSHVYAVVKDKQTHKWIAIDPTVDESYPGWEPPEATRERTFMGYAPGNFRPTKSVIPKQPRMGFYKSGNFRGLRRMGDPGDPVDVNQLLQTIIPQSIQELPTIIGAATGTPAYAQTNAGISSVGGQLGLNQYGYSVGATASPALWIFGLALVGGVLWVAGRR